MRMRQAAHRVRRAALLSAVMLVPSPAFRSMALGIMVAVIFVLAATLTLLPAVLARLNARVDALALPWVHAGEHRSARFGRWAERLWTQPIRYGLAALVALLALARRPNAAIKISGVCTMSREPFPYPDIWDPLARVFDAWGFERCLWGTDWTRTFSLVSYAQGVEPFRLTDRAAMSIVTSPMSSRFEVWPEVRRIKARSRASNSARSKGLRT